MEADLKRLRASLLERLRVELTPADGAEAFDRHILLAVRIHRAAGLSQTVKGEGAGWNQFLTLYFPEGRNSEAHAKLLWDDWRLGLVKHYAPKSRVSVTHGQPECHWKLDDHGALCIDLESMWDDYEYAVDGLVQALSGDASRRKAVLALWFARTWITRPFYSQPPMLTSQLSGLTSNVSVGSTMGISMKEVSGTGRPFADETT